MLRQEEYLDHEFKASLEQYSKNGFKDKKIVNNNKVREKASHSYEANNHTHLNMYVAL